MGSYDCSRHLVEKDGTSRVAYPFLLAFLQSLDVSQGWHLPLTVDSLYSKSFSVACLASPATSYMHPAV